MRSNRSLSAGWTSDDETQIQTVLECVRQHLKMDVGFVAEFVEGRRVFRHVDVAGPRPVVAVGDSDPLEESYCYYVVEGRMPELLRRAADDPIAGAMPVTDALPVGAHLSVPIRLADGRIYGTLCCFSMLPDASLNSRDLDVLRMSAEIIGRLIDFGTQRRADLRSKRERIGRVLRSRSIEMLYQPIFGLTNDRLEALEALARFPTDPSRPCGTWFEEAAELGLGPELEFLAVEEALRAVGSLPTGAALSINVSPGSVLTRRFDKTFSEAPVDRVILELTEHAAIGSYAVLNQALAAHRERGLRLAIDDVGAGHSSFRHVLELKPDLIKLDMSLTRNIDVDLTRQALAESITRFSHRMGCSVVAEGVETIAELDCLRSIGVANVQGYLTGRPVPLDQVARLHESAVTLRTAH